MLDGQVQHTPELRVSSGMQRASVFRGSQQDLYLTYVYQCLEATDK
jgi:hypothetical protein